MQQTEQTQIPARTHSTISGALAIVGSILLFGIVVWGVAHVAVLSGPWFSSLFPTNTSATKNTIIIKKEAVPQQTASKPQTGITYAGSADLTVQIVSAYADQYGNGVVEFDIRNIGGSPTGAYTFSAQLPTSHGYFYTSPPQASLAPGDHILNTLRFGDAMQQGGMASVIVDPQNLVQEANKTNNQTSLPLQRQYQYAY